jgi:hypothetical protein
MYKKIELITNISIVCVAVMLSVVLVENYFLPRNAPRAEGIAPGSKMLLENLDWQKNPRTLLVALSPSCRYCVENASFYQRLAKEADRLNVPLIALTQLPTSEAEEFLRSLNVPIKEVLQVAFDAHNIRGTPTLILTDEKGTATSVWRGRIPPEKEGEIFSLLEADAAPTNTNLRWQEATRERESWK